MRSDLLDFPNKNGVPCLTYFCWDGYTGAVAAVAAVAVTGAWWVTYYLAADPVPPDLP